MKKKIIYISAGRSDYDRLYLILKEINHSKKADLNIFLEKQIGVAEHIDYVATAEKKLDVLATAMDKLEALKSIS